MRLVTSRAQHNALSPLVCLVIIFTWPSFALAQGTTSITPTTGDGNLGTTVTTVGHVTQITGGTRPNNGANLFHSFDQFNIGHGDTAQFLNTTPSVHTQNILSRVTGGNPSSILGIIDTTSYPEANLYLMNPAGIVFGPSATLQVSGSVAFTTADYLRLPEATSQNSGIFHADPLARSLLTSAPVVAFGFIDSSPAPIAVQKSMLNAQPGQSISLVGGNISVESGTLGSTPHYLPPSTHGMDVYIASVASPGEILAGTLDQAPNITGQSFGALGTVQLSQQAHINTSGVSGGQILIRGGRLIINDSIFSTTTGDISLDTTSIRIERTMVTTDTSSMGNAGHIRLKALEDIILSDGLIGSRSRAVLGNAGNIMFSSNQGDIRVSNSLVTSQADNGPGNAGNILLSSSHGNITIIDNSAITSQANKSNGNAGTITLNAPQGNIALGDTQVFNRIDNGSGRLGGIQIIATNLLLNKSEILENNFAGQVAGSIGINVEGRLDLSNGSVIHTAAPGPANAADLIIRARDILIINGSTLFTGTTSSGSGGRVDLSTNSLTLQNGGSISATTTGTSSHATGGAIIISATDQVTLTNSASITASSVVDPNTPRSGIANAGNIFLNAGKQLSLHNGSSIKTTTESTQASGGNITIQAIELVRLVNKSEITTSVKGAEGSGGNIFIDPNMVIVQGSNVTAQAVGGAGGNISFVTPLFLADSASIVSASSQRGVSGTVTIQSPTSNLSGAVGQLVSKLNEPQVLLQNRCTALVDGLESTFVLVGRSTLPPEPGDWLSPSVSIEHWTGENLEPASDLMVHNHGSSKTTIIARDQNMTAVLSLRRLTPPGFLVQTFATNPNGCPL